MSGRDQLIKKLTVLGVSVVEDPIGVFRLGDKITLTYYGRGYWILQGNVALGEWIEKTIQWKFTSISPKEIFQEVEGFLCTYFK